MGETSPVVVAVVVVVDVCHKPQQTVPAPSYRDYTSQTPLWLSGASYRVSCRVNCGTVQSIC